MKNASRPAAVKLVPDPGVPLMDMSLKQFHRIRRRSRVRTFWIRPFIALRRVMLKLALATWSLDEMTIEARPAFWQSGPAQYYACIRTRRGLTRLVAKVTVAAADQPGKTARVIHIADIYLPAFSMKFRRSATDAQQEEEQP